MRTIVLSLSILILSLGAFALDESITLRFLLTDSVKHFNAQTKKVKSKLRGLGELSKLGGLSEEQRAVLSKNITVQTCRKDAYEMLYKISKSFKDKDALSSAFITRRELELKGDDLLSLYDFFIQPYLEYLNYKTEYLTALVDDRNFRTNEALPLYVEELNVDGFCLNRADFRHYGEDGEYPELELTLPDSVVVNDVKRSKQKYLENEVAQLKKFEIQTRTK